MRARRGRGRPPRLVHGPEASERETGGPVDGGPVVVAREAAAGDRAGRDRVHANAVAGPLDGERLGEVRNRRPRPDVCAFPGIPRWWFAMTLTIRPPPAAIMRFPTAWVTYQVPFRFVSMTAFHP